MKDVDDNLAKMCVRGPNISAKSSREEDARLDIPFPTHVFDRTDQTYTH